MSETDAILELVTKKFLPIRETPYKEWSEDLKREMRLAPEDSDLVLEVYNLRENGTLVFRNGICGHPGCFGGRPVRDSQQHARQHMTETMQRELPYVYMGALKNHINADHTYEHEIACPLLHCGVVSYNQVQAMLHEYAHTLAATSASPATIKLEEDGMVAAQSFPDKMPALVISDAVATQPQPFSVSSTAPTVDISDKAAHRPGAYRIQPPFRREPTPHLSYMPIPAISKPANQSCPPKASPTIVEPLNSANPGALQRFIEDRLPVNWVLEPEVRAGPGEPIDCGDGKLARYANGLCTLEAGNGEVCGKNGWRCGFAGCTTQAKSRKAQVRAHYLKKHHTDKYYACKACDAWFACSDDVRYHERTMHNLWMRGPRKTAMGLREDATRSASTSLCASASEAPAAASRKRDRSVSGAHAPEKLRKTSIDQRGVPLNSGRTLIDSQPCVAPSRARPMSPLPGWTPLPEATEHAQQAPTADTRDSAQVRPRQVALPCAGPTATRALSTTRRSPPLATRWSPPPTTRWPTSYERSAVNRALSTTRESSVVSLESWATPPPITPLEGTSRRSSFQSLAALYEAEAADITCNEVNGAHGEDEDPTDDAGTVQSAETSYVRVGGHAESSDGRVQVHTGQHKANGDDLETDEEDDDEEDQLLSSEGYVDIAEGEYASDVEFELKHLKAVEQSEQLPEPSGEGSHRSEDFEDELDYADDDLEYAADDLEYADH
ncbi:hypothetical protein FB107DRAFT_278862 [Schizophyllum commune]